MHENFFHTLKVYYEDTDAGGVVYYANYLKFLERARKQKHFAKSNFSWENMRDLVGTILEDNLPEFAEQVQLQMPKLELPKLEKLK